MIAGSIMKRGIMTGSLILVFAMTSCAPNGVMTRKGDAREDRFKYDSGEEEFIYNDGNDNNDTRRADSRYDDRQVRPEKRQRSDRYRDNRYDDRRNYDNGRERKPGQRYDKDMGDDQFFAEDPSVRNQVPEKRKRYYQKGNASWYGREFHGRLTASGERFDMNQYTAAHRSLPFGTVLMVKNLDNGRKVKVKVNDRGPFKKNRILDVSYAAAKDLGMLKSGEAMVGIAVLDKTDTRRDVDRERGHNEVEPVFGRDSYNASDHMDNVSAPYQVQAGAFYSRVNADKLKDEISSMLNKPVVVVKEGYLYKVRITNVSSKYEAEDLKRELRSRDIPSYIIEENR